MNTSNKVIRQQSNCIPSHMLIQTALTEILSHFSVCSSLLINTKVLFTKRKLLIICEEHR